MFAGTDIETPPVIPDGVEACVGMFKECHSLRQAPVIPESARHSGFMFLDCKSLENIPDIPSELENWRFMFKGCSPSIEEEGIRKCIERNPDKIIAIDNIKSDNIQPHYYKKEGSDEKINNERFYDVKIGVPKTVAEEGYLYEVVPRGLILDKDDVDSKMIAYDSDLIMNCHDSKGNKICEMKISEIAEAHDKYLQSCKAFIEQVNQKGETVLANEGNQSQMSINITD